jgi:membrane associated rhomboid family serine protease
MALVEVYRSYRQADCDERAFVLAAVGVQTEQVQMGDSFALLVPEEAVVAATMHLDDYNQEKLSREAPPLLPMRAHPSAWLGSVGYAFVLVSIAHWATEGLLGVDWFSSGELVSDRLRSGEWWRVVTALTLHADAGHLVANIAFGAVFGYLAGQLLGPGIAWASILAAGAAGNLLDGLLMPATHRTIGASTAVFATLGLLAAFSWRRRSTLAVRWPHRWAPLIAAVALLGLLGTGAEHTDVLAHLAGFLAGTVVGLLYGSSAIPSSGSAVLQLLCGAAAVGAIVGAWVCALIRA